MTSPDKTPMTKVMLGEKYIKMPPVVMGMPLTPAEKSIIGTAVTTPVAGRSSHCQPLNVPAAPIPLTSLKIIKAKAMGTMEKDSMNTDTWLSRTTFFLIILYVAQVRQMIKDSQGTTP